MNIFFLSKNPKSAARAMCDRHVVKIILEVCQMMWCAYHITGDPGWNFDIPENIKIYKKTHAKHPISIWVRKSQKNYNWTARYGLELCHEYTRRYGKIHSCEEAIKWLSANPPHFNSSEQYSNITIISEIDYPEECTPPPLAISDRSHIVRINGKVSLTLSYIEYYLKDKSTKRWFNYTNSTNPFK